MKVTIFKQLLQGMRKLFWAPKPLGPHKIVLELRFLAGVRPMGSNSVHIVHLIEVAGVRLGWVTPATQHMYSGGRC